MYRLKGIVPALLTPFDAEGKINKKVLRQLVRMNINKGVDGFYCCGSTSEVFLLSTDERKELLETVMEEVNNECAVIAHIGAISQDTAIELAKHAESLGVDAISSVPPFYYKFSLNEIKDYYYSIVDEVSVPMIIYNYPALLGMAFDSENIGDFFSDKRIIGIKHTSNDFYSLNRFKALYPDKIIFNGYDQMFLSSLAAGADGGIGTTYSFMAEKFIVIKKLFDEGKVEEALKVQTEVNDIVEILNKVGMMPGSKEILNLMGLDFGECRKPFKKINEEERELLKTVVRKLA